MAGIMKDFFDRCYYPVLGRANGRAYAALICAGSDGTGALRQLDRIATGWRLKRAAEGFIVITHAQTAERCLAPKVIPEGELEKCAEIGTAMVEGLRLGVW
jgi:multimeric flavodoxin WrbA